MAESYISIFIAGVIWIIEGNCQWISEYRRSFAKVNSVFCQISCRFLWIPLKFHF